MKVRSKPTETEPKRDVNSLSTLWTTQTMKLKGQRYTTTWPKGVVYGLSTLWNPPYNQLQSTLALQTPCYYIKDTPIIRTAAKSPAKQKYWSITEKSSWYFILSYYKILLIKMVTFLLLFFTFKCTKSYNVLLRRSSDYITPHSQTGCDRKLLL